MAVLEAVSRGAVLAAMEEFDNLGRERFLTKYGFGPAREYFVVRNGRQYDSKALLGAAYGVDHPEDGPLRSEEFSGGETTAVRRLEQLGFEVRRLSTSSGSWIFQANPKYYDIRGALRNLDEMNWTTAQHADQIKAGDTVFVWESGPQGGILGRGTLLTDPREMPDQEGQEFIRDEAKFSGSQTRVRLRIDDVLPAPIGRGVLAEHPVLRELQPLKFANATNFKVTPEQRAALDELFARAQSTPTDGRLQRGFEAVLRTYGEARLSVPFRGDHEVVVALRQLAQDFDGSIPVAGREDVEMRWSAGRGNWAKVPWLACLDVRETTSTEEGIYVVYLFRQDMTGVYLTLAQGVTRLRQDHGVSGARGILRSRADAFVQEFGSELGAGGFNSNEGIDLRTDADLGSQYETSTIAYKFYEAGRVPDDSQLLQDLDALLEIYGRHVVSRQVPPPAVPPRADLRAVWEEFSTRLRENKLVFGDRHDEFVRSFIAALATKPFVILTGLSGSGKTQLAVKLGEWFGEGRLLVEPVRPDWTGAEALFGYEDALQPAPSGRGAWSVPRPLEFILKAAGDPYWPYLLVLDEMNLAHVERYFADVLSGMESRHGAIPNLVREDDGRWRVAVAPAPERLPVPRNLFVAGTVNVDETTYMFSPKVLDRANTFEFRVQTGDLSPTAERPGSVSAGTSELVRGFLEIATDDALQGERPAPGRDILVEHLFALHGLLSEGGFEFGHRVLYEVMRFAAMLAAAGNDDPYTALDEQVMQKVLPRLHGSRRRLEPSLAALGKFCFDLTYEPGEVGERSSFDPAAPPEGTPRLPLSFDKVRRMMRTLRANQFASFTD